MSYNRKLSIKRTTFVPSIIYSNYRARRPVVNASGSKLYISGGVPVSEPDTLYSFTNTTSYEIIVDIDFLIRAVCYSGTTGGSTPDVFSTTDRVLVEYNNAPELDLSVSSPNVISNYALSYRNIDTTLSKTGFTPDTAIQGIHYCVVISGTFKANLLPGEVIGTKFNFNMTKFELNASTTSTTQKTFYQEVRVQPSIQYLY